VKAGARDINGARKPIPVDSLISGSIVSQTVSPASFNLIEDQCTTSCKLPLRAHFASQAPSGNNLFLRAVFPKSNRAQ